MNYILVFAALVLSVQVKSNPRSNNDATYRAGVVEFNLRVNMTGQQKIQENTKRVIEIIRSDETKYVDILVFPEAILNDATVPIPISKSNEVRSPCDSLTAHWLLHDISCAVRKSAMYVVINLITKDEAGAVYNMALVFDRKGAIIAKYRKYHLFGDAGIQRPPEPDVVTFTTDFNVTFGVFICFDLSFEDPAITLVKKGIKNLIYPTMWYSELPYLTAVQIQYGWAYANNVNLLAANANRLETATFGSGIYTGRRSGSSAFIATGPTTKVIIADVPIDPSLPIGRTHGESSGASLATDTNIEYNLWKEELRSYNIKFLEQTTGMQSGAAHSNGIRCNYNVSIRDLGERRNEKTYYYAVASFNGYRSYAPYSNARTAQKICGVIACTKLNDWTSCGEMHKSATEVYKRFRIDQLELSTDLQINDMKIVPNTLAMNLKPLQKFNWTNAASRNNNRVVMKLIESNSDILTFSIYARDFQYDILNYDENEPSERKKRRFS